MYLQQFRHISANGLKRRFRQFSDFSPVNILAIDLPELEKWLQIHGFEKYRAKQIWHEIYERHVDSFNSMPILPASLRSRLASAFSIGTLVLKKELVSSIDGTRKRVYNIGNGKGQPGKGQLIESVLMMYEDNRVTACISSQAGCAMACKFCATGQMGFKRNLTSHEIFEQVWRFDTPKQISNVVLMGMGEPLANFAQVKSAILAIQSKLHIGFRHITLSTVGIAPKIIQLADDPDINKINLAISLHTSNSNKRLAIMPRAETRWPTTELMEAIKCYIQVTDRRVSFEVALIPGLNDSLNDVVELGELLLYHFKGFPIHVNFIPLNKTRGFDVNDVAQSSGNSNISNNNGGKDSLRYDDVLQVMNERFNIPSTLRVKRGIDIEAGCGQLATLVEADEEDVQAVQEE